MEVKITKIVQQNIAWFKAFFPADFVSEKVDVKSEGKMIAFGAVADGCACGLLLLAVQAEDAEIRSVYVAPDYRKHGVATALIRHLCHNSKLMEHRKLTATYPEDGEFSYYLDRIFLREGLLVEATRCFAYRNTIRELIGRPRFQMALKRDLKAHGKTEYAALCEIPAYRLRALNLPKDLNLSRYNPDYSVFAMEGERLVGMLLVRNLEEHWLNLDYLENRGTNPAVTISLLCAGCMALLKNVQQGKQNPEDELTFQNFGQNGLDFATRFLKIDPKKVNWYHIISTREDSYGW